MVSASGHGVFLKNLSVSLVQLKTKQRSSTTSKQEGPTRANPSCREEDPGSGGQDVMGRARPPTAAVRVLLFSLPLRHTLRNPAAFQDHVTVTSRNHTELPGRAVTSASPKHTLLPALCLSPACRLCHTHRPRLLGFFLCPSP